MVFRPVKERETLECCSASLLRFALSTEGARPGISKKFGFQGLKQFRVRTT